MTGKRWVVMAVVLMLLRPQKGAAIWFSLPATGTKCLSEQIYSSAVVLGNYYAFSDRDVLPAPAIAVQVKSPVGNVVYEKEHVKGNVTVGRFSFTTTEAGMHVACFRLITDTHEFNSTAGLTVSLDWKIGIFAKDWESVAKAHNIEGLELELKKLEETAKAIRQNTIHLMIKDLKMQRVSKATNKRVACFSFMSVGLCILVSALQVWHLKTFFRNKKLI
ncbi:unnamed protein product [Cuscuta epithymum]|uniref:GOLD domain-containing protein n=1 Tax=Cuscuta epithymum TaxID=186058 RepID=A0AAV0GNE4_9ASTE|nr:unnamed protein product [Cuscuta epithymum]CAH9139451.1 unnamed protein product [Cuscuta epithymum]CAH9148681.1 unnamed protein product [Cuscuta epithymum]